MNTSDAIAGISAVISLVSAVVAWRSMRSADRSSYAASDLQRSMFQRQFIVDLHGIWSTVNDIDQSSPVAGDVRSAANALDLTASLWNFDVVKKEVILSSYWESFSKLYDKLNNWNTVVPGFTSTGRSMLSAHVRKAYEEMKPLALKHVSTSAL